MTDDVHDMPTAWKMVGNSLGTVIYASGWDSQGDGYFPPNTPSPQAYTALHMVLNSRLVYPSLRTEPCSLQLLRTLPSRRRDYHPIQAFPQHHWKIKSANSPRCLISGAPPESKPFITVNSVEYRVRQNLKQLS